MPPQQRQRRVTRYRLASRQQFRQQIGQHQRLFRRRDMAIGPTTRRRLSKGRGVFR